MFLGRVKETENLTRKRMAKKNAAAEGKSAGIDAVMHDMLVNTIAGLEQHRLRYASPELDVPTK